MPNILVVFPADRLVKVLDTTLVKLFGTMLEVLLEVSLCVLLTELWLSLVLSVPVEVLDGPVMLDMEMYPTLVSETLEVRELEPPEANKELVVILVISILVDEVGVVDDTIWPRREAREMLTQVFESHPKEYVLELDVREEVNVVDDMTVLLEEISPELWVYDAVEDDVGLDPWRDADVVAVGELLGIASEDALPLCGSKVEVRVPGLVVDCGLPKLELSNKISLEPELEAITMLPLEVPEG